MVSFVKYWLSMSMLHFDYCVVVFPVRGLKLYQYHVRGFGSKQQGCGLVCLQTFLLCSLQCVCMFVELVPAAFSVLLVGLVSTSASQLLASCINMRDLRGHPQ